MRSSIFKKQLATFMTILTVSILMLSLMLTGFFTSYLRKEKEAKLEGHAKRVSYIYSQKFEYGPLGGYVMPEIKRQLEEELESMSEYMNIEILLLDSHLQVEGYSKTLESLSGDTIQDDKIKPVFQNKVVHTYGNLNGKLDRDQMITAYPIEFEGNVVGATIVVAGTEDIEGTMNGLLRTLLITSIPAIVAAFISIYIASNNITKPLRTIEEAASKVASGDFDKKIEIDSTDEVGELADSFNHMADSLHTIEQSRREFIANISHDIRSPLTSMSGFLEAILDGTIAEEDREKYLRIVLDETNRLSRLSNDILELSRLENLETALDPSVFDINELLRQIIMTLDSQLQKKDLDVHLIYANEMDYVEADEQKIKRVIVNLLDNAIKFSDIGSTIEIETTMKEHSLLISIQNFGEVVSEEEQDKIFDRFYKADISRGEDKSGSGLGLSIVKDFIKAHNEEVTFTSSEEEGTIVAFSLPLSETEEVNI